MISKTRMRTFVQSLRWKEVQEGLRENAALVRFRAQDGQNWLHLCCRVNVRKREMRASASTRTAQVLLDAGIDINEPSATEGTWKATPLWHAIAFGDNVPLAKYLLERGSDPNHCLWAAVNQDNGAVIRLLLEYGADDPSDQEATPLLAAVQWSKFVAAAELLKSGADVNFQDKKSMTALHYLLKKRSELKYVQLLLKHGARVDLKNADGITAAEIMQRRRDPQLRALAAQLTKAN